MKPVVAVIVLLGAFFAGNAAKAQTTPPKLDTKLLLSRDQLQPGQVISASLIVDIPSGYHLNAHEPISKFALPTKIEVQVPDGYKLGPIFYPRAIVRRFSFTDDRLGVYEKRAVIKFSLRIPSNEKQRTVTLKTILDYQSCSDEVCFPPKKQEASVVFKII